MRTPTVATPITPQHPTLPKLLVLLILFFFVTYIIYTLKLVSTSRTCKDTLFSTDTFFPTLYTLTEFSHPRSMTTLFAFKLYHELSLAPIAQPLFHFHLFLSCSFLSYPAHTPPHIYITLLTQHKKKKHHLLAASYANMKHHK